MASHYHSWCRAAVPRVACDKENHVETWNHVATPPYACCKALAAEIVRLCSLFITETLSRDKQLLQLYSRAVLPGTLRRRPDTHADAAGTVTLQSVHRKSLKEEKGAQLIASPSVSSFWQARRAVGRSLGEMQHMRFARPRSLRTMNFGSFSNASPNPSDRFKSSSRILPAL